MRVDPKKVFNAAIYGVGILILAGLVQKVGIARWGQLLQGADKRSVLLAAMIYAAIWPIRTLRLGRLVQHAAKSLPALRIFEIHISGFALNSILPAKVGDVAMVGFLKNEGIKTGSAVAIAFQARILDVLALVLVTVPSWIWLMRKDTPLWMGLSFLFCAALVALPLGITWADKKRKIASYATEAGKRAKHPFWGLALIKMGEVYAAYHSLVWDKVLMLFSIACSIIIWMLEGSVCYVLVRALGVNMPIQASVLAVALGNAGKGFPVTPGGIGVYEGILTAVLCSFGAPFEAAVTAAILDHLLKKGFTLVFGFFALIRLRRAPMALTFPEN